MTLRYHNGDTFGFNYNGEEYYYIKNVQNDIVAIADKNGDIVANYYYDAWGNVSQITGNTTKSFGQKVNFTNLTAVYTGTTEIKWDDKTTKTIYTDVGFSGYALLALAYFLTSGEPVQAPETFPQPVPAQ